MVDEDWSQVRSIPRAKRRMKKGYRQRVRYHPSKKLLSLDDGRTIIGHPKVIAELERAARET